MNRSMHEKAARLVDRGFALFDAGRYHDAEDRFRAAVVCDPDQEDAWIGLGAALGRQQRSAEAAIIFGMAAATAQSSGAWPTLLAAEALLECGEVEQAQGALAWFDALARRGTVSDEQEALAATLRGRARRTT